MMKKKSCLFLTVLVLFLFPNLLGAYSLKLSKVTFKETEESLKISLTTDKAMDYESKELISPHRLTLDLEENKQIVLLVGEGVKLAKEEKVKEVTEEGQLTGLRVDVLKDKVCIKVSGTSKLKHELKLNKYPPRLEVKLSGVRLNLPKEHFAVYQGAVKEVRAVQTKPQVIEVFVDLTTSETKYGLELSPDGKEIILITEFPPAEFLASKPKKVKVAEKVPVKKEVKPEKVIPEKLAKEEEVTSLKPKSEVTNILIRRKDSQIQVSILASSPLRYRLQEVISPPAFIIEIPQAQLSWPYKELLVEQGNVKKIFAQQSKDRVLITVQLSKVSEYSVGLAEENKQVVLLVGEGVKLAKEEVKKPAKEEEKPKEVIPEKLAKEEVKKPAKEEEKPKEVIPEKLAKEEEVKEVTEEGQLTGLRVDVLKDKVCIKVSGTSKLKHELKLNKYPPRLEVKLSGVRLNLPKEHFAVYQGAVKEVRAVQTKPQVIEVFVDLTTSETKYSLELSPDGKEIILITEFPPAEFLASKLKEVKVAEKPPVKKEEKPKEVIPDLLGAYSLKLSKVTFKETEESLKISLTTDKAMDYESKELISPHRLVLDLKDTAFLPVHQRIPIEISPLTMIKVSQFQPNIARVVLVFDQKAKYELSLSSDKRLLLVEVKKEKAAGQEVRPEERTSAPTPEEEEEVTSLKPKSEVTNILIRRKDSQIQMSILADSPLRYRLQEVISPPAFIIEIPQAQLSWPYKELLVEQGNVKKIFAQQSKDRVLVTVQLSKVSEYSVGLAEEDKQIVLLVGEGVKLAKEEVEKPVKEEEKPKEVIPEKLAKEEVEKPVKEEEKPKEVVPEKLAKEEEVKEVTEEGQLTDLRVDVLKDKVCIKISGTSKLKHELELNKYPPRLEVKFLGVRLNLPKEHFAVYQGAVKEVRVVQTKPEEVKILADLTTNKTEYSLELSPDGKEITLITEFPPAEFLASKLKEVKVAEKPPVKEEEKPKEVIPKEYSQISEVSCEKVKEEMKVVISGDQPLRYKLKELSKPDRLTINIFNAQVVTPEIISVNRGAIRKIRVTQEETKPIRVAKVTLDLTQKVKHEVTLSADKKKIILTTEIPPEKVIAKKIPALPLPPVVSRRLVTMDFKEADIRDVLRIFADWSGMNIVADATVVGVVTLSLKNIPFDDALDMVLRMANSNLKYRLIDNTILVSTSQDTLNRVGAGMLIGDMSVETFPLKGYTADEFKAILTEAVPEVTQITTAADRPQDSITLVGSRRSLERVRNLLARMSPIPEVEVKTFDLGGLKEEAVKEALLKNIPGLSFISSSITDNPNTITVSGNQGSLKKVEKLMAKLNLRPAITYQNFILTEIGVEDFEKILAETMPGAKIINSIKGSDTTSVTISGRSDELTSIDALVTELNKKEKIAKTIKIFKLNHLETLSELQEQTGQSIESLLKAAVPGLSEAGSEITLDNRTNSIIVKATPSDIEKVERALKEMDVKLPQVLIEVMIVEFGQKEARSFSSNWVIQQSTYAEGQRGLGVDLSAEKTHAEIAFNFLKRGFRGALDVLISEGKTTTIASPKVATVSGHKATIELTDSSKIFLGNKTVYDDEGHPISTEPQYQDIDVGVTFDITPRVNEDKTITLNLSPTIKTLGEPVAAGQTIPVNTRTVNTLLRIPDGQTIEIGGLIKKEEFSTMSRVPFLSELPIVGRLFRSTSYSKREPEVKIFLTPRIMPAY